MEHPFICDCSHTAISRGARCLLISGCPIIHSRGIMMNLMMKKISFAAILFAVALLVAAPVAQATTVSEVQAMITQLKGKVEVIIINGKNAEIKDRPGLQGQLDSVR